MALVLLLLLPVLAIASTAATLLGYSYDPLVLCSSSVAMAAGGIAATASGAAAAIPAAAAAAGSAAGPPAALLRLLLGGAAALTAVPVLFRAASGGKQISEASEAWLRTVVYCAAGFVFALGLSVSGGAQHRGPGCL